MAAAFAPGCRTDARAEDDPTEGGGRGKFEVLEPEDETELFPIQRMVRLGSQLCRGGVVGGRS